MESESTITKILAESPGNEVFADYAENLRKESRLQEAIQVCLAGLSANPACVRGRLALARVMYQNGYKPFALRELDILHEMLPNNKSVARLIELVREETEVSLLGSEGATVGAEEKVMAATEFDIEDFEA